MHRSITRTLCASLFVTASISASALAQSRFATSVANYTPGTGTGAFADPSKLLGGPQGGGFDQGSFDVCTLGVGGSATLAFDVVIADGPGADLSVFENALTFAGAVFSEVAWVEVSTDGVNFARFPNRYAGPSTGLPGFTAPWGTYSGLTGGAPTLANVATNSIDPLNPVVSGGEAFDLADLQLDPLVQNGTVNLAQVNFVRIVDIPHASGLDSFGNVIWDNSGASGSGDFDAVAVLQHTGTITASQPRVDLYFDALGYLNLDLEDPDGFTDLDQAQLKVSYNLVPTSITRLRGLLPVQTTTATGIHLRSSTPIAGSGRKGVLAVSAKDFAGQFSADQIALQG